MCKKLFLALSGILRKSAASCMPRLRPVTPPDHKKIDDTEQPNRFWQASLRGGNYMVAIDRISSISRHSTAGWRDDCR